MHALNPACQKKERDWAEVQSDPIELEMGNIQNYFLNNSYE